jgi:hypothetical protein
MALKTLTSLASLSLAVLVPLASGQTADDYFHGGVTNYVFGKYTEARKIINEGLAAYPNDPKLGRLKGLLQQEEQQSQPSQISQNSGGKDKQNKGQQPSSDFTQPDNPKDKQQGPSGSKDKQEPQPDFQEQSELKAEAKPEDKAGKDLALLPSTNSQENQSTKTASAASPAIIFSSKMTPEQARQLLEAARLDEQMWRPLPPAEPRRLNRPRRDW